MRKLFRISLKWKIFFGCLLLSDAIVSANFFYTLYVARRSAARSGMQMKMVYRRYEAFQRAQAGAMSAAADVWAGSPRLQEAFAKGDDAAASAVFDDAQERLRKSIHPDFVLMVDKHGCLSHTKDAPFDVSELSSMRLFADLKQGMSIDNTILEHKRRTYLVAAEPVKRGSEVVGAVVVGRRLDKLFADYKDQSDDDPKKQVELALVHNQETTAASLHTEDWDDIARASRTEARETLEEGGEKVSLIALPDGKHEYFNAGINGYDGGAVGSVGSIFVLRNRADRTEQIEQLAHDALKIGTLAAVLAAVVSFFLGWMVNRPIQAFIDATRDLAHGEGDLTKRIDTDKCGGATETQELAENLNAMFSNLHRLAAEVQGASLQVGASSAEISAASKQMLGGASDQAQKIESSTAAVTELSSSIQQVAENAVQATKVARESGEGLTQSIGKLGQTSMLVEETAQKIQALGQSGRRIGNIVEVIRQISEQTSLLALNASIEAAHAGEQGRGFAVVADEVSSLARRVGQSAKDIEGLIATISEQTAEAVTSMQNVTRAFGEHTSGASAMQNALKQIVDVVQDTARSVQEQAVVSDEIARNMDAVQKIAQEVLGSSKEAVLQGEQLHALALRLEQLVRGFRIDDNGEAPALRASPSVHALPQSSSERRKVARG
jgi:methyl-accepting chemotaxis protein